MLDQKIARYRTIMNRVLDDHLASGIGKLIEKAQAEKAALHEKKE